MIRTPVSSRTRLGGGGRRDRRSEALLAKEEKQESVDDERYQNRRHHEEYECGQGGHGRHFSNKPRAARAGCFARSETGYGGAVDTAPRVGGKVRWTKGSTTYRGMASEQEPKLDPRRGPGSLSPGAPALCVCCGVCSHPRCRPLCRNRPSAREEDALGLLLPIITARGLCSLCLRRCHGRAPRSC
jgi:hypothetical protein